MKERRMTRKRIEGLSCLLAEQVSPQERLLWRSCPDPKRSSAARARSLLVWKTPSLIALGSLIVGVILAVLSFFSSTAQGIAVDSALSSSAFWFLAVLVAGLLVYAAPGILHAASVTRPLWWCLLMASPFGPLARHAARRGETSLVEPPLVPPLRGGEIYGLTDRRVIILEVGKRRLVHSLWLHEITGVQCVDAGDGWGDLILVAASSGLGAGTPGTGSTAQREATRMFGIERACHVEQALRCLLAHKPLEAALDALTEHANTLHAAGAQPRTAYSIRAQQWQTLLWCGPTPKELEATVIYGASLSQLRAQARTQLLSQCPRCFCNCSPPSGEQRAYCLRYVHYSCSEHASGRGMSAAPVHRAGATLEELPPDHLSQDGSRDGVLPRYRGRKGAARATVQTTPGTPSKEQPQLLTASPQEAQGNQSCQWMRASSVVDRHSPLVFARFEDAVDHFVEHDLLPERGPAYIDELLAQDRQLRHAQTMKVVDDELAANDLLHRGGWHLFHILGMTAPRGQVGPVLFVLGHPEDNAV